MIFTLIAKIFPIDSVFYLLLIISIIYCILILRKNTIYTHLNSCPLCDSKALSSTKRRKFYTYLSITSKKYYCNGCKKRDRILSLTNKNRKRKEKQ